MEVLHKIDKIHMIQGIFKSLGTEMYNRLDTSTEYATTILQYELCSAFAY